MESTQGDLGDNPQVTNNFLHDADASDNQDSRQSMAYTQESVEMDADMDQLGVDVDAGRMVCLEPRGDKLAPIDRLPVEILSMIFELVGGSHLEPSNSYLVDPPLKLMHISS